jgi:hypothetical protein
MVRGAKITRPMILGMKRLVILALPAPIAVVAVVASQLLSTGGSSALPAVPLPPPLAIAPSRLASRLGPSSSTPRHAEQPRENRVSRRVPVRPVREEGAAPQKFYQSRAFLGNLPVPGGYAAVAMNLGIAPTRFAAAVITLTPRREFNNASPKVCPTRGG